MNINLGFPDRRKRQEDDPSGHSTTAGESRSKACARLSRNAWRLVAPNGAPVRLTHREWLLLQVLWKHKGTPVSREAIAKALGHDDMYIGNSLEALVSRLRNKMRGGLPWLGTPACRCQSRLCGLSVRAGRGRVDRIEA